MKRPRAHCFAIAALPWLLSGLLSPVAQAQLSGWLDFDGAIKGEAVNAAHKDWIDIQAFSVGVGRGISMAGGADRDAGRPSLSEVSVAKELDRSSPALFVAATSGGAYPKVTLDLNSGNSIPLARLELENVLVSAQSFSAASGGAERPMESISLNFTKITYTYIMEDSGTIFSGYDIETGEASSGVTPGGSGNPDSDNDGMPDAWETSYGLSVGINDANGDLDGDGLTNLHEYQLGTNPKSGTSFFKATLTPVTATSGTYQLTWNSVAGKTYVIEWSPDLVTPFASLRTVTATAASSTESISNAGTVGFYRVRPQ